MSVDETRDKLPPRNSPNVAIAYTNFANADVLSVTKSGQSVLVQACSNEDADPKVIRYLLQSTDIKVNQQNISKSTKWNMLLGAAKLAVRLKINKSKLIRRIAESGGLTALHYAARRGDMEIVELLLEHGAKPSIKNDMGRDVLS